VTYPENRGVVYRHLDDDGRVLYVGSTHDIRARTQWHLVRSSWGDRIASVHHSRRIPMSEARRQEAFAIALDLPPMNKARNPLYGTVPRAEQSRLIADFITTCPVFHGVPDIVDDEPEFLAQERRDLPLILGTTKSSAA